jgi:hypothetical protein
MINKTVGAMPVGSSAVLGGILGISAGLVIGVLLIKCVLDPLWSKFAHKPAGNHAGYRADYANPRGAVSRLNLPNDEPPLPLLVGTNELWRVAPDLRLEDGKLTVRQLGKDKRIHFTEPVSETILDLKHVEPSGSFLYCVVHVIRALPPNDPKLSHAARDSRKP